VAAGATAVVAAVGGGTTAVVVTRVVVVARVEATVGTGLIVPMPSASWAPRMVALAVSPAAPSRKVTDAAVAAVTALRRSMG
jgi:hypothetical protein